MNKKGLIFIFFFVVTTVSTVAVSTTAEQQNNKVEINFNYVPSAYVDVGELWVEIDNRYLDDNQVFSEQDEINFGFFYDIAWISWANAPFFAAYGDGWQTDNWLWCPENNATEGYVGDDDGYVLYNETRFAGIMNVMLDDYDLGVSNFDPADDIGSYQTVAIELDVGWHYLTIVAAELVSDGNHTEWYWTYAKDQKVFYIAENRNDVPPLIEAAYNNVTIVLDPVNSEDLGQYYDWDSFAVFPRPIASATTGTVDDPNAYQVIEEGTETAPLMSEASFTYNASDTELGLIGTGYGCEFANWTEMGPHTAIWNVNNGRGENLERGTWNGEIDGNGDQIWREGEMSLALSKGQNFVFFSLFGLVLDDYAYVYGDPTLVAIVSAGMDLAVVRIFVGEETGPVGMGFGILISVSMLGLVAALGIVRRRK
jgi:hypothetical protein